MPYVRTRLGRWFYEERGTTKRTGDPTIALWPGLLFDGGMWRNQIEPLESIGRVVVFDGPGHGKSELSPPFSLEDNVEALVDAFGELKIDRSVMVGLSWGGMVGMRLALQHPERVRALALLDTSAEAEERSRVLRYRLFFSFARRFGFPKAMADETLVPLYFTENTCATRPEIVERFVRSLNGFSREGLARASMAVLIRRKSILPRLGSIRAPTLVLCGREDRAAEAVHSHRIAQAISGAKLVMIEGAGHVGVLEQPKAVNDALVAFVREAVGA